MRTHTGDKPWKCPLCPHSTSQSDNLKLHMRKDHGESSILSFYKCDVPHCSFESDQHSALKTHIRLIHPKEDGLQASFISPRLSSVPGPTLSLSAYTRSNGSSSSLNGEGRDKERERDNGQAGSPSSSVFG